MKLPECSGYSDYWGNHDCEAEHDRNCEECLCCWHEYGGTWNPERREKFKPNAEEANCDPNDPRLFVPYDDGVYKSGAYLAEPSDWVVKVGYYSFEVMTNKAFYRLYEEMR